MFKSFQISISISISIKDNRKPSAGKLSVPTATLSSPDFHVAHNPVNSVKTSGQASCQVSELPTQLATYTMCILQKLS